MLSAINAINAINAKLAQLRNCVVAATITQKNNAKNVHTHLWVYVICVICLSSRFRGRVEVIGIVFFGN